jgi:hypothetical protein
VPDAVRERLKSASSEEISLWAERILFANALDEIFHSPTRRHIAVKNSAPTPKYGAKPQIAKSHSCSIAPSSPKAKNKPQQRRGKRDAKRDAPIFCSTSLNANSVTCPMPFVNA